MEEALGACPRLGLLPELGVMIFDILGIPREKQILVPLKHRIYGTLKNGNWTGIVRELIDGEYDTTFPDFTPMEERLRVIDVSYPVFRTQTAFMTR